MKYRHIALLTAITLLCGCSGNIPAGTPAVSESEIQPAKPAQSPESAAPEVPETTGTTELTELTTVESADNEILRLNGDWCDLEELPLKVTRYSPSESTAHPELWEYTNGEKRLKSNITARHITADGRMILLQRDFPAEEIYSQYSTGTVSTVYSLDPAADELKTLYSGEMTVFAFSDEYAAGFRFTDDGGSVFKVVSLDSGEAFEPQLDVEYTSLDSADSITINGDDVFIDGAIVLPIEGGSFFTRFRYNIPSQAWAVYNEPYPAEHDEQSVYHGWDWLRPDSSYEEIKHDPDEVIVNTWSYFRTKVIESAFGGKTSRTLKYTANNGSDIEIGSTDTSQISSVLMTRNRIFLISLLDEMNGVTRAAGLSRPGSDCVTAALLPSEECFVNGCNWFVSPDRIWLYNYGTLDSVVLTLN